MAPKDWKIMSLEGAARVIDCKHRTPKYVEDGVPLVSPGTIKWGPIDLATPTKRVTFEEYESLMDHCTVELGDLVMSRNQSVGVASYVESSSPFVLGQDTVLVKSILADSRFLFYSLQSIGVQRKIFKLAGGSTFSRINLGDIRKLSIDLPPLPEQTKIAQILSTWDKAIATVEKLIENSKQQKKALMQQLLTGKKSLQEKNGVKFSGEWKFLAFDEAFKVANKKSAQVKSSEYLESGSIPIVDQGKKLIAGYCNNEDVYSDVPVIIFGDHTRCLKWIDFAFCPGADGTQVLNTLANLDKKFCYYLLVHADIANLGYSRHMRELKEKDFKVPKKIEEQQKIAAVLSTADREITTFQYKLGALKQEKKALMQQLLTGKRRVKVNANEAMSA